MNEQNEQTKSILIEAIVEKKARQRDSLKQFRIVRIIREVFQQHGISAVDELEMINLDRNMLENESYERLEKYYDMLTEMDEYQDEIFKMYKKLDVKYKRKSVRTIKNKINRYFDEYSTNEAVVTFFEDLNQEV